MCHLTVEWREILGILESDKESNKFGNFRANFWEFRGEKGPFLFVPHWNNRTLFGLQQNVQSGPKMGIEIYKYKYMC